MRIEGADEVPHTPLLRATSRANSIRLIKSNFSADQLGWNPIILRFLPFFPECSALALRTFLISRSSISCFTFHFAGSASTLPGWIAFTHTLRMSPPLRPFDSSARTASSA